MKRFACYLAAVALHALILFGVKPPASKPVPLVEEKKYIEVTLAIPPPPEPPAPPSEIRPPLPPKVEPLPPEPPPPPPKVEEPLPDPKPEPPLPEPASQAEAPALPTLQPSPPAKPIAPMPGPAPVPSVPGQYLPVTQPSYLSRVEPAYPTQSRRLHEQGSVTLALYINELGSLDKVEIVKDPVIHCSTKPLLTR